MDEKRTDRQDGDRQESNRQTQPRPGSLPAADRQDEPLKHHGDKLERAIPRTAGERAGS